MTKKSTEINIDHLGNSWPNPYRSVAEFFAAWELPNPRGDWRLTEYELGQVNGLPKSYGRVVATNGIMCYIQVNPETLYLGHFTAWVPEQPIRDDANAPRRPFTSKATKIPVCFAGM